MKKPAENIWVLPYSLRLFGADLRRMVTVIRLRSGELIIHSTGPFTQGDVAGIMRLGKPGRLLDVKLRHDTFTKQGHEAFPNIPFLAPDGFSELVGFSTEPLIPAPAAWGDELEVLRLEGVPRHAGAPRLSQAFAHLKSQRTCFLILVLTLRPGPAFWPFAPLAPDTILACRGRSEWRSKTRRPSNDP
jgi:hypothetical protein